MHRGTVPAVFERQVRDDGVPLTETLLAQRLDPRREDHGIADQDVDKRDDAQDRQETQRRIAEKQSDNDANQRQRRDRGDLGYISDYALSCIISAYAFCRI